MSLLITKIRKYFDNKNYEIQERIFVVLSVVALFGLLCAIIVSLFVGESMLGILFTLFGFIIFLTVFIFGIKTNNIRISSNIIAFILVFIFIPATFVASGGVFGGSPVWFCFATLFIGMIITGKTKIFFLLFELITMIICWFIQYKYPHLILTHSKNTAFLDSFWSLITVSFIMTILVSFQTYLYKKEAERSREQKKEIENLNYAQNRFFSSMSHEIRTPINTIIGLNEMILREDISDEVAEDATNIEAAGRMLLNTINDILDMSKIRAGHMILNPVTYSTRDMLSEIIAMVWVKANEKKLEFQINIDPDLPSELFGDDVRIRQILINILNNAIKYTSVGIVNFSVQYDKKDSINANIIFTVTDTGLGIKKESIPYLFSAYKRSEDEGTRHIEGTGLGLSIVKELVDMMNGKITVNSIFTRGSTFIIEIPQEISNEAPIGALDFDIIHQTQHRANYKSSFHAPNGRVLVVDDNASNILVVKKLLRDTDVIIDSASSGEEALQLTLENQYHVIFMDHLMPEMDGIEAMHRIQSQTGGLSRDAKIIVLTANTGAKAARLYKKEGFDDYLIKPISGDLLETTLIRHLPRELVRLTSEDSRIINESKNWISDRRKKSPIMITTESIADLPKSLIKKYHIEVIPYRVSTSRGIFRDNIEVDNRGIIDYIEHNNETVTSIPPTTEEHEAFFAKQLMRSNHIIHITVSRVLNNTAYESAIEASRSFDNVTVVDSQHLSSGQGMMVVEAARMAYEGFGIDEIMDRLVHLTDRIHSGFIVDNMDYLANSDQVNARIAHITKAFMIRPIMVMKEGNLKISRLCFGMRKLAWKKYIKNTFRSPQRIDRRVLFITHAGLTQAELSRIKEEVEKKLEFENVYFQKASSSISVNCGPKAFGLLYMLKY